MTVDELDAAIEELQASIDELDEGADKLLSQMSLNNLKNRRSGMALSALANALTAANLDTNELQAQIAAARDAMNTYEKRVEQLKKAIGAIADAIA